MTIKNNAAVTDLELKNILKINDPSQKTASPFQGYIKTKSVFRLQSKPIAYKILLHAYGTNSMYEHEIVYLTFGG